MNKPVVDDEEKKAAALVRLGDNATADQVRGDAPVAPYSQRIFDELVRAYGWQRTDRTTSLKKTFSAPENGKGRPITREFRACFDESRERYLSLDAGWVSAFDIDCRDRDIQGVAMEFDQRATRWSHREISMPALPPYARKAVESLEHEGAHRTAARLDELLETNARAMGVTVDEEARLNARHLAGNRYREYPVFRDAPYWPEADIVARDASGRPSEVAYAGALHRLQDLVADLASGNAAGIDATALEAVMNSCGIRPGRSFDIAHSPNSSLKAVADDLCEALDLEAHALVIKATEPFVEREVGRLSARFVATTVDERKTMDFAVSNYGYLLGRNEKIGLIAFADRIAECYDASTPQTAEVLRVLRHCAQNPINPGEPQVTARLAKAEAQSSSLEM
jgi:hypothetical protein